MMCNQGIKISLSMFHSLKIHICRIHFAAAKNIAFTQARAIVHDSFDDIGMKIKAEFHKLIIGQKGVEVRDMMNRYDLNISEQGRKNSYSEKEKRFSIRLM